MGGGRCGGGGGGGRAGLKGSANRHYGLHGVDISSDRTEEGQEGGLQERRRLLGPPRLVRVADEAQADAVVRPGGAALVLGRPTGRRRVAAPPPPAAAHGDQPLELGSEAVVEPAVDEGVVARAAHGQPVEGEVKGVRAPDGLAGQQHHVAVQREPADGEHHHHEHQHLQGLFPPPPLGHVLLHGHVADVAAPPQAAGHGGVGHGDDDEREEEEKHEREQVKVLPVEVGGLWEVRHAEIPDSSFTLGRERKQENISAWTRFYLVSTSFL